MCESSAYHYIKGIGIYSTPCDKNECFDGSDERYIC